MTINNNDNIPTVGFGPFGLFLVAAITILTLSILYWVRKSKERKTKRTIKN